MGALPQALEIIFEHLSVWSPTSLPYPFALGPIQGHRVQHLLVTLGRLKRFFLVQP
jgi:hypothetical protein